MKWTKFALTLTLTLGHIVQAKEESLTACLWQAADARDAAHPSFNEALSQGNAEQKRIAALSLGRIGGDNVVGQLTTLLSSDEVIQRYALFGLGISLSEQASAPLQAFWRAGSVSKNNRAVALLALANRGNDDAQSILLDALSEAVKQKDTLYAAEVAHALGQLWSHRRDHISAPAKETVPLLLKVVAEQTSAATMAAFALSRVRKEADFYSIETVLTEINRASDPRAALFLARAYGTPASSKASATLLDLAQNHRQFFVRYEAAFALARAADEQSAWSATAQLRKHRDSMTTIAAIQGLSERPALIEQHRAEVEKWRENEQLTYSVNRALPNENKEEESKDPAQTTFNFEQIKTALGARYRVQTERGEIIIRLSEETPYTSYNFATLADKNYFDGRVFFRVVPGFVAQTGDPLDAFPQTAGNGGPGYSIREELNLNPQNEHWLGMATAGKDTAGSQFFFNVGHNPHLDWHYTTFAKIEKGVEVIAKILPGDKISSIRRM